MKSTPPGSSSLKARRSNIPAEQILMRSALAKALSLVYGLEVLIVLKDLWGLEFEETTEVATWAATALVRAAVAEAAA